MSYALTLHPRAHAVNMRAMKASPRVYGGRTADERRKERRQRLIEVAIALWEDEGWPSVTMRRVCAEARLTDRYFYESFGDRDELLVAAWDTLRDEAVAAIVAATLSPPDATALERLRAAITRVVKDIDSNPKKARIQFAAHSGSHALEARRRETTRSFNEVLVQMARPYLRPGADEDKLRMSALLGIGGFLTLLTARYEGVLEVSADELIDHATAVGAQLAAPYVEPGALSVRRTPPDSNT